MQILDSHFINCWFLFSELQDLHKVYKENDFITNDFITKLISFYKFPVQSIVLSPNLTLISMININEILGVEETSDRIESQNWFNDPFESSYKLFLENVLKTSHS